MDDQKFKKTIENLQHQINEINNIINNGTQKVPLITFNKNDQFIIECPDLKERIKKSPYTQRQFAELIGINEQSLSNIVKQRNSPSLEVALKISYMLNTSVNELFILTKL